MLAHPVVKYQYPTGGTGGADGDYTSRFATASAFVSMKSRRGST